MKIVVYADESGTHDKTGTQKGSRQAILGGLVAPSDDWTKFCKSWQSILDHFHAPYFHFREWATASAIGRKVREPSSDFIKNPYRGWTSTMLDEFLITLVKIVGSGNKLIVGGAVHTNHLHQARLDGRIPLNANPYEPNLDQFFINVVGSIDIQRAPWKRQPVSFFFDQSSDIEWEHAVLAKFHAYKARYTTFKELTFANKKQPRHLPLQAADMIAYRTRQITEKWVDGDHSATWPELDEALFKPTFDFLDTRKSEVLIAFLRGELEYVNPIR